MNDRADLAVLAGFDGVHVGQGDLSAEDAKAVMIGLRSHPWARRMGHPGVGLWGYRRIRWRRSASG